MLKNRFRLGASIAIPAKGRRVTFVTVLGEPRCFRSFDYAVLIGSPDFTSRIGRNSLEIALVARHVPKIRRLIKSF
jgi:hypothetical protein